MTDFHAGLSRRASLFSTAGRTVRRPFTLRSAVFVLFAILLFGGIGALGQGLDPVPPQEPQPESADSADVSSSGAFSYSRPISIPIARGPAPHFGLSYSSGAGNGIAGCGWQLTGLPAIGRIRGDSGMNFAGSGA